MKKLFRLVMAAAVIFSVASCAKEDISASLGKGQVEVTFTANLANLNTRASVETFGKGENVDVLYYYVYDAANNAHLSALSSSVERGTDGKFTFTLPMMKGMLYDIVFWAQAEGAPYGYDPATKVISVTYGASNDDTRDAFYKFVDNFDPTAAPQTIQLYRPFAQLNAATNDLDKVQKNLIALTTSQVTVKAYTQFNLETGVPVEASLTDVTFTATNIPANNNEEEILKAGFTYLSMNYMFAPKGGMVTDATYLFKGKRDNGAGQEVEFTGTSYSNIPLKQNYRTNILGALLTKETEIKVEILPGFGTPDEVVDIWDGKTTSIPSYDEVTKTFTINNGAELAWVAGVVNGTIPATRSEDFNSSFNGLTIRLAKSIDLGGSEWTPIGVGGKRFSGTIDGNNKTISNFQITKCHGDKPQAALFGNLALTTLFKDLTIANATVIYPRNGKDFYGAALIGTAYGSVTCQNVTVKDSYISGNNKVGAILAHDGRTSNVKIDNCHVLNSTIESLDSADGGCVGGLIGYFAGIGGGEFKISNSTVKQSTINGINSTNSGKRANSQFIGCINSDANQQLYINNCSVEDNIFTDVDNNGNAVTYKSIYGKFIGGERYDAPKGKVYIDNVEVIANGIAIDNEGNYCITAVEGFAWIEAQTDNFFSGKTIKLVANMNLEGIDYKPIRFWDPENPIIFDGQNYTISNLTINNGSSDNQALFNGTLSVKNLKVDNATVTGRGYTAAICGSLYGNIDNCHITNSTITGNYWQVGGFVGQHDSGMITNSSISKSTINGPSAVGALTGITNESTKNRKFENCSVTECAIVANYSFGGSYDLMYGVAVGLINIENSEVYFNDCTIDNNTIKGVASDELYGVCEEGTVVYINNTISVSNNEQLKAAAATQSTIMLANGNDYDLNGIQKDGLKLIGIGNNVRIANTTQYASGKSTGAIWKAINLENMTITNTVYTMADGSNASFTKVTFEAGFRQGYGKNVIFTNCSFGSNSEGYALHFQTDSASDGGEIKLTGCQFNGGKVHLGGKRAYTFSGCEFAENTDFQVWSNITLENCTVDGVAVTSSNIATLFPNLNLEKVTLK